MITLRNVRVTGFSRSYYDVYWEVAPTTSDLQEYEFYVERSEAEAGPFQEIAGPLIDRFHLRDNDVPLISSMRTLFYRIKVRHPMSGKVEYSETVDRWGQAPLIAQEIIRLETLLFQEFNGRTCWTFPRRTFGQRCPQCWDHVMQKCRDDQCPTCFKTGISGGYHYPVQFFGQIDEAELQSEITLHDHHAQKHFRLRCPASPELKPDDLLIDYKNRRMKAVKIGGTSHLGVRVRQEITLVLLQPGSIEDAVPLKVDAETLQTVGWRNYINPHNVEAITQGPFDDGMDFLLGRFGHR